MNAEFPVFLSGGPLHGFALESMEYPGVRVIGPTGAGWASYVIDWSQRPLVAHYEGPA